MSMTYEQAEFFLNHPEELDKFIIKLEASIKASIKARIKYRATSNNNI